MTQVWTVRCDGLGWLKGGCLGWAIAAVAVASTLLDGVAIAQIAPDGTLGRESSVVTPRSNLRGAPGILIQGGAVRGSNLFQSFAEFNVGAGQRVYFANPAGIANILSRVTGANPSNILGTLGVAGAANLFLLNPNGIVFGPKARLDVAGSFVASTATSLSFGNGSTFSATDPEPPPLLAVNLTPGLQYGTDYRGAITNAGNLAVGAGQTLTLAGSTVSSTGALSAPGGLVQVLGDRVSLLDNARIDVSSRNGGGTVLIGGDFQGKGQVPNASQTIVAPGVTIAADALQTGNGGKVVVWANNTTRFDGTISARGGATSGNGGAVEVSGKQTLTFNGVVNASAPHGTLGTLLLDPTNITIVAGSGNATDLPSDGGSSLLLTDNPNGNSTVRNGTINNATANVILQASNDITFAAPINITALKVGVSAEAGNNIFVNANITTNGGGVALDAQRGVFINQAIIDTNPFPDNSGTSSGSIGISGREQVSITDGGLISRSNNSSTSDFSAIGVVAPEGSVSFTRSTISTTNRGTGYAGDIVITARDQVSIVDSNRQNTNDARSALGIFSQGNFGRIFIGASSYSGFDFSPETISIDNSFLSAANSAVPPGSSANAGNILVQASGLVSITNNSRLQSRAVAGVNGNAGGIGIGAGSLFMQNSVLDTSTFSKSSVSNFSDFNDAPTSFGGSTAGAVVLFIDHDVTLIHSDIFNNLENGASGQAGVILIAANSLSLLKGAQIQTIVRGKNENGDAANGNAGNILIGVDGTVKIIGQNSAIFSDVGEEASGDGGKVVITGLTGDRALSLQIRDGAGVSVNNVGQSGVAGDVSIAARGIWLDNNAAISAESNSGRGGNVLLDTLALILGRNGNVSATAGINGAGGNGGNIAIGTGNLQPFSTTDSGRLVSGFLFDDRSLLVAGKTFRNNNVIAEADKGTGGNIRITTFKLQDIANRSADFLTTNDITTKSFFGTDGTVVTNTLNVFPSLKANPLPARYDVPRVAEGCDPRTRQESSRFIITGRGGVPIDPSDVLNPETIVDSPSPTPTSSLPPSQPSTPKTEVEAIVPARGFRQNADGTVQLTAYVSDPANAVLPDPLLPSASTCYAP